MKIGIFGGSFDPVHLGHLSIAHYLIENDICREVMFLPSGDQNPMNKKMEKEKHRFAMLKLSIEKTPQLSLCDLELNKKEVRFTFQSMNTLAGVYGYDSLAFILGMDNLRNLYTWHNSINFVKSFDFIIFNRPREIKVQYSELIGHFNSILSNKLLNSTFINSKFTHSSSEIRDAIKKSHDTSSLLSKEVADYIKKHQLYAHRK